MSERDAIDAVDQPAMVASLVADLHALGLEPGATVMVHSSLSRLGYVAGGAQAVVTALLVALGPTGTLVMPTHSTGLSDPGGWSDPPVPEAWWDTLRAEMPAYDPALTPTREMGAVVECFRHLPGVRRSWHPTVSAAATGPNAETIVTGHELAHGLGERSPQARLYDLDGHILLLGIGHANNTSLHLGEYRSARADAPWSTHFSPVLVDGRRRWAAYPDLDVDHGDFDALGADFVDSGMERAGGVGVGTGRLMGARQLVDFAESWFRANRANRADRAN